MTYAARIEEQVRKTRAERAEAVLHRIGPDDGFIVSTWLCFEAMALERTGASRSVVRELRRLALVIEAAAIKVKPTLVTESAAKAGVSGEDYEAVRAELNRVVGKD